MRRNREQHRHRINCHYSPRSTRTVIIGVTGIAVALTLNIRNNVWGYWINLCVLALADTGPLWPGIAGPVLWILGWILTTVAYFRAPGGIARR